MKSGKSTDSLKHLGKVTDSFVRNQGAHWVGSREHVGRAERSTRCVKHIARNPISPATSTHKDTRQQADDLLAGTF